MTCDPPRGNKQLGRTLHSERTAAHRIRLCDGQKNEAKKTFLSAQQAHPSALDNLRHQTLHVICLTVSITVENI